ncbi:MAG: biopolymer transporter ExbD [Phycisphaerales bacterium]|nr:biopolymer transporter ExbD [Phycisphaerales bacterium]
MKWSAPHRRRSSGPISLNIASMIDVVFLLLMYFMVATDFSPAEETFRMDLPDRTAGSEAFTLQDHPLQVEVLAAGVQAQPVFTIAGWGVPTGSVDTLRGQLQRLCGEGGETFFLNDHPVEILVSPQVAWSHAVEAFNAAVRAGFTHVRLDERSGT